MPTQWCSFETSTNGNQNVLTNHFPNGLANDIQAVGKPAPVPDRFHSFIQQAHP